MDSIKLHDGTIITVGAHVSFSGRTHGTGTVTGFGRSFGSSTVKIAPDGGVVYADVDRYPLRAGGEFNVLTDIGISTGAVEVLS